MIRRSWLAIGMVALALAGPAAGANDHWPQFRGPSGGFVIQAGPEFKVLGKSSLGEMTLATPAVSRGSLIIRTASRLYRVGTKT